MYAGGRFLAAIAARQTNTHQQHKINDYDKPIELATLAIVAGMKSHPSKRPLTRTTHEKGKRQSLSIESHPYELFTPSFDCSASPRTRIFRDYPCSHHDLLQTPRLVSAINQPEYVPCCSAKGKQRRTLAAFAALVCTFICTLAGSKINARTLTEGCLC
jgi:hypothetical protein